MRNVVLVRVDDRLIHGQVVTGWIPYMGVNHLIIVDDEIARNKLTKRVLASSAPSEINFHIYSAKFAAEVLKKPAPDQKERIMLLVKSPLVLKSLMEEEFPISEINLGGMGLYDDRKAFFRNISCTDEELETIRKFKEEGVCLYYQLVPDQKRFDSEEFMDS